jgi:hypothetical protein
MVVWHFAFMESDIDAYKLLAALSPMDQLPPPPRPLPTYTVPNADPLTRILDTPSNSVKAWVQDSVRDEADDSSSEFAGTLAHIFSNSHSQPQPKSPQNRVTFSTEVPVSFNIYNTRDIDELPTNIGNALREFRDARLVSGATHCVPCFRAVYNPKSTNPLIKVGDIALPHPFFYDSETAKWKTTAKPTALAKNKIEVTYGLLNSRTEWFIIRPEGASTECPDEILKLIETGAGMV